MGSVSVGKVKCGAAREGLSVCLFCVGVCELTDNFKLTGRTFVLVCCQLFLSQCGFSSLYSMQSWSVSRPCFSRSCRRRQFSATATALSLSFLVQIQLKRDSLCRRSDFLSICFTHVSHFGLLWCVCERWMPKSQKAQASTRGRPRREPPFPVEERLPDRASAIIQFHGK